MRTVSLFLKLLMLGCMGLSAADAAESPNTSKASTFPATSRSTAMRPTSAQVPEAVVVFIGDSLTEGYGVKQEDAYPEVVGRLLAAQGQNVRIINGGISGSVSADADRRLKWFLKAKPNVLVLALGGNDALKGTPVEVIRKNLAEAIDLAKANGIKVLLCGIEVFTNLGPDYGRDLASMYHALAREKNVSFMPFLLADVALKQDLNQADMKHPNAKGHAIVAQNVARQLQPLLVSVRASGENK